MSLPVKLVRLHMLGDSSATAERRWDRGIIAALVAFGVLVRAAHLFFVDWRLPFHEGGLFLLFAELLAESGMRLPDIVPFYSADGIPYAYPPLAFWIGGLLLRAGAAPAAVSIYLPAVLAMLAVPAFAWVLWRWRWPARRRHAALLAFATLPAAFTSQIEAAGVAEALGSLALLFLADRLWAWLDLSAGAARRKRLRRAAGLGAAWAMALCAAPGSALAATIVVAAAIAWRRRRPIDEHGAILGVALLLAAPYWAPVSAEHGPTIFLRAAIGQQAQLARWVGWDITVPPPEVALADALSAQIDVLPFAPLFAWRVAAQDGAAALGRLLTEAALPAGWLVLFAAGALAAWRHGAWWLPAIWIVFALIPREGVWLAALPGAALAGWGLVALNSVVARWLRLPAATDRFIRVVIWSVVFGYVTLGAIWAVQGAAVYATDPVRATLDAYAWGRDRLPADASLIVVQDISFLREWSPYYLRRPVLNVPQGNEWQPAEYRLLRALAPVWAACPTRACLAEYATAYLAAPDDTLLLIDARSAGRLPDPPVWLYDNGEILIGPLRP